MTDLFPFVKSLKNYSGAAFKRDLFAGLTVGVMLIPQGMAYAMIAGLPPVYGLYAAIFPQLAYSLFGSSRQLSVGPVAMDSLLVAAGVSALATVGSDNYIALAILLAMTIGLIQIAMGVLRVGFLVNFLSKPVISGFMSAAALIIGFGQLKYLFGIDLVQSKYVHNILIEAFDKIDVINWVALVIGLTGIALLIGLKNMKSKIPGGLLLVVIGTSLVYVLNLHSYGLDIVGSVPSGMPKFTTPLFQWQTINDLLPIAFTLSIIGFMESYSIAKVIQNKHRKEYEINPNRELISLGIGNFLGSLFSSYPSSGSFGRSAVNNDSGAQSVVSSWVSIILIVLTLLFLTPLVYYLPKAILASIIVTAVFGLIDWKTVKMLWKVDRYDFFMLLVAFAGTLFLGIELGVILGVLLSLFVLIYKTSDPHMALLGRVGDTEYFRNLDRYENAIDDPEIAILRFDARLYFANINALKKRVDCVIKEKPALDVFILDAQSMSDIDSSGLAGLLEILDSLNDINVTFKLVSVIGPVRDKLQKSGFVEKIGMKNIYPSIGDAISNKHQFDMKFQPENA